MEELVAKKTDQDRLRDTTFKVAQKLTLQGYAVMVTYSKDGKSSELHLRRRGNILGHLTLIYDDQFVGNLRFQPFFNNKNLGDDIVQLSKASLNIS
jgi:hypothetical protein